MHMGVMAWSPMAGGRLFGSDGEGSDQVLRVRGALNRISIARDLSLDQVDFLIVVVD
jgi:predicted oxidoreductase